MNSATQWLFVLAPFLIFAAVFAFGLLGLHALVGKLRDSITSTANTKEIHLRSPWGSLDVHPNASLDPRLAKILMYPGAAPLEPGVSEYDAEVHLLNQEFKGMAARYWTSAPEQIVWEFYHRELPDWKVSQGRELLKAADGWTQAIVIHASGDRTIIETSIRVHKQAATAHA
jgi:hypothetical protein